MNPAAITGVRAKLKAGDPVVGMWVTFDAPAVTEIAVSIGLDWVIIDKEHGYLDWGDVANHLRCVSRSSTMALVRIPELSEENVKRALDIGADGIVVPGCDSAEKLLEAVEYGRYAPYGKRGLGGDRATGWGTRTADHVQIANEHTVIMPLFESVDVIKNLNGILKVAAEHNVDMFYFGPADHCASAGEAGQWDVPQVADEIREIVSRLRADGRYAGVITKDNADLDRRVGEGFQIIGLGMESSLLISQVRNRLDHIGRGSEVELP